MMVALQVAVIVAFTVGVAYAAWWCLVELYVKLTMKGSPKSKTCTAEQEMEHYQTLFDEWEPVEGSPLHESLVQAIADAQVRADAAMSEQEWRAHIKAKEDMLFSANLDYLTSYSTRRMQWERGRRDKLRTEIDELKARRDKARQYLADSRRAV